MEYHVFAAFLTFAYITPCPAQFFFPWTNPIDFAYWALGGPGIGAQIPQFDLAGANPDIMILPPNVPPKVNTPPTAAAAPAATAAVATPAPTTSTPPAAVTKPLLGIIATSPESAVVNKTEVEADQDGKKIREVKSVKLEGMVLRPQHRNGTMRTGKMKDVLKQSLAQFDLAGANPDIMILPRNVPPKIKPPPTTAASVVTPAPRTSTPQAVVTKRLRGIVATSPESAVVNKTEVEADLDGKKVREVKTVKLKGMVLRPQHRNGTSRTGKLKDVKDVLKKSLAQFVRTIPHKA